MRTLVLCLTVFLCSCQSSAPGTQKDRSSSVGFGFLGGGAKIGTNDDTVDAGGTFLGGRFDVVTRPSPKTPVEVGVRAGFGIVSADLNDLPFGTSSTIDADQFVIAPMLRLNFESEGASAIPYLEAAVGFQQVSFDQSASGGGLTVTVSDSDSGLWYAIGAGVAFRVSENGKFVLGGEYQHSEFQDTDATADAYVGQFGFRIAF